MTATSEDISVVLSGGSVNTIPNLSLGGNPSNTAINLSQTLGNLFDDVSPEESDDGYEDYRCFYIFNDAEDASVYDLKIWITESVPEGSSIEIGIQDQDEAQRITITGTPTGGAIEVSIGGENYVSNYNSNLAVWAEDLETGLNSLEVGGEALFTGIVVSAQNTSSGIVFDIQFSGYDGKRIQDEVEVNSTLTGTVTSVTVVTLQNGSPINTIAPTIDIETTPPGSVNFFVPIEESPIEVPRLGSGDGFPLWVRRTVDAGATAVALDGFGLRIRVSALKPE